MLSKSVIHGTHSQECSAVAGVKPTRYDEALQQIAASAAMRRLVALECPHCGGVHAYWRGTKLVYRGEAAPAQEA